MVPGWVAFLIRRVRIALGRPRPRPERRLPGFGLGDGWSEVARPESHRVHLN